MTTALSKTSVPFRHLLSSILPNTNLSSSILSFTSPLLPWNRKDSSPLRTFTDMSKKTPPRSSIVIDHRVKDVYNRYRLILASAEPIFINGVRHYERIDSIGSVEIPVGSFHRESCMDNVQELLAAMSHNHLRTLSLMFLNGNGTSYLHKIRYYTPADLSILVMEMGPPSAKEVNTWVCEEVPMTKENIGTISNMIKVYNSCRQIEIRLPLEDDLGPLY